MAGAKLILYAGAKEIVRRIGKPERERIAAAIAAEIPAHVPVVHGGAIRTYRPTVIVEGDTVAVDPGSPLWHLLEYGTATSPAYRPVQNAVRALGIPFEPR